MTPEQKAALERLIDLAQSDTGQSRRASNFLLAWWNAGDNGGFDLTDLWGVDRAIAADMQTVFGLIATTQSYPDAFGYRDEIKRIWRLWRGSAQHEADQAKQP